MSVKNESKINQLLQEVPAGAVYLTSWMKQNNIPHSTQHRYVESAWLTPIGTGAMIRTGDTPTLYGAMYSLNTQADKHLTIGAMSALEIHGYSHYLPMGRPTVSLSAPQKEYLPLWFRKYDWGITLRLFTTEIFNSDTGITTTRQGDLYPGTGVYGVSAPRSAILRHYRPLLCDGNAVDTPAKECATTVGGVPFRQSEAAVPLYGRKGPSCVVRGPQPRQNRPRQWQAGNRQRRRLR